MNELYAILMSWAITLSGYEAPAAHAAIVRVPHSYLVEKACNGHECKVMGWFPPGQSIFIDDRLQPRESLHASSVLVHEMVHYLQHISGRHSMPYSCEQIIGLEREAYGVQREFLLRYGVYQPVGLSMHSAGCELAATE